LSESSIKSYDYLRELKQAETPASRLEYDLQNLEGEENKIITFDTCQDPSEQLQFIFLKRQVID